MIQNLDDVVVFCEEQLSVGEQMIEIFRKSGKDGDIAMANATLGRNATLQQILMEIEEGRKGLFK